MASHKQDLQSEPRTKVSQAVLVSCFVPEASCRQQGPLRGLRTICWCYYAQRRRGKLNPTQSIFSTNPRCCDTTHACVLTGDSPPLLPPFVSMHLIGSRAHGHHFDMWRRPGLSRCYCASEDLFWPPRTWWLFYLLSVIDKR
jgi:hypothetical protein